MYYGFCKVVTRNMTVSFTICDSKSGRSQTYKVIILLSVEYDGVVGAGILIVP
jgi:hypothetical protein